MVKRISHVKVSEIDCTDIFFVDTNVLFAVHFNLSNWLSNKISVYSSFIVNLLNNGNTLCVSALNLQELYHLVEKIEYNHYISINGKIRPKEYRQIASERTRIAEDLKSKHLEISEQYSVVQSIINFDGITSFVDNYEFHHYDPIDFFVVNCNEKSCINFITDDSDFKHDSSINVYSYE